MPRQAVLIAGAIAVGLAACAPAAPDGGAAPPQAPGPDGLRAHLAAARRDPARAVASWRVPEARWRGLVTGAYEAHWDTHAAAWAAREAALVAALRASGDAAPRTQYADDPALSPGQVHLRWMLRAPGLIHADLPVVFVHDGAAWRAVVDLDPWIAGRADAAAPGCAATYATMAPKACQEWAWAIAEAALRDQPDRLARACAQARALGC